MSSKPTSPSPGQNGVPPAPDPEVKPKSARRRTFTAKQKLNILEETDDLPEGELGAYLRRKGLYWSALSRWRKAREEGVLAAMTPRKRGASPKTPETRREAELEREVVQLGQRLERAEKIIEVQKKLFELLELPSQTTDGNGQG